MSTISPDITDTVYTRPPRKPFEAMPVGGGDLTAMVRVADTIELHLGKCDSWGFRDWHNRIHTTELLSPGHVTIHLSPDPVEPGQLLSFEQRLSPQRGLIETTIRTRSGDLYVKVWGDVESNVLVVDIDDRRSDRGGAEVELWHWRNEPACTLHGNVLLSEEIQAEAVLPQREPGQLDPYQGRGTGIAIGSDCAAEARWFGPENASLIIPAGGPAHYLVLIACETTPAKASLQTEEKSAVFYRGGKWLGDTGSAAGRALSTLQAALAAPAQLLQQRHAAWWAGFWQRSSLRLEGDANAAYLTRLWHLFYYQMAISSRGHYPTHFNGGPGLYERDLRSWMLEYVWQNDREHLWPLDGANHAELTENVWRMYAAMIPYVRQATHKEWGIDGLWLDEGHQPWWDQVAVEKKLTAPLGAGGLKREQPVYYTSHIFSSGPELVQQMLDHARHSGDETFLRQVAYPWLAGVCEFYANWAARGEDRLYHFFPANANETWWTTKDTLNDLCAVRVLFPEFVALSKRYGQDQPLAALCADILAHLPGLPVGKWRVEGEGNTSHIEIDAAHDVYGPARDPFMDTKKHNMENPECYVIFPWSLTGIGATDYERALRTFVERECPNLAGWSQCGVQAARLGLRDQAAQIILDHARRHQTHPFGGWNSPGTMPYRLPDGTRLCDCPYLDAAGENATAIQEMLLQSYPLRGADDAVPYGEMLGGTIRVCPALPAAWSGSFRLHAMGGFLVACDFAAGKPTRIAITSERGNRCSVANPWQGPPLLEFDTVAGETYTLLPPA